MKLLLPTSGSVNKFVALSVLQIVSSCKNVGCVVRLSGCPVGRFAGCGTAFVLRLRFPKNPEIWHSLLKLPQKRGFFSRKFRYLHGLSSMLRKAVCLAIRYGDKDGTTLPTAKIRVGDFTEFPGRIVPFWPSTMFAVSPMLRYREFYL